MCRKVFKSIGKEEHVVVNRFLLHPIKFYGSRPKKEAVSCIHIILLSLFSSLLLLIFSLSLVSRALLSIFLFLWNLLTHSELYFVYERGTQTHWDIYREYHSVKKRFTKEKNIERKYIGTQRETHWNENMYFYHLSLSWLEDTKACNIGFQQSKALKT